jgi:hypothetical protein
LITDAVGFDSPGTPYREGSTLTSDLALANQSYYRSLAGGLPKDTGNNASDFLHVRVDGVGGLLGAPGPENLSSPIQRNSGMLTTLVDSTVATTLAPNRVRNTAPYLDTLSGTLNYPLGTLSIRRTFVNNTGQPVKRLRFRIVDISAGIAASGLADMRAISSNAVTATSTDAAHCAPNPAPCVVSILGTTLEQPPIQSQGGASNSTLLAGDVTLSTPLANGQSINVQWLLGMLRIGTFRVFVNVEALP